MTEIEEELQELPKLLSLYRHWDEKRQGRPMPVWEDFELLDMKEWLGNLNLVDVEDEGRAFRYRVFGSNLVRFSGRDMTGRCVHDSPPDIFAMIIDSYVTVAESGAPLFVSHEEGASGELFRHYRLLLPLGADGHVSRILVGSWPVSLRNPS